MIEAARMFCTPTVCWVQPTAYTIEEVRSRPELSHSAPPAALATLSTPRKFTFERRAPYYLRYLLSEKFGLRTCADIENADLRQLYVAPAGIKASSYLRLRRRRLLNAVCQWTNEKKYRVNELLTRLIERCDQLGLRVHNDDPQQDFLISSYITTLVMNYLFTGKFKRTK